MKLHTMQRCVVAVIFHELMVGSEFNHAALIQHHDAIRIFYGRQSVCDYQGGSILHQLIECPLETAFIVPRDGPGCA